MRSRIRAIRLRRGQAARRLEQPRERSHCRGGQHGHACKARVDARLVRIRALPAVVAVPRSRSTAGWRTIRAVFVIRVVCLKVGWRICPGLVAARMVDRHCCGDVRGCLVGTDAGHCSQLQPDQTEERQQHPCEPALPVPDPVQASVHQVKLAPEARDCKETGPRSSVRPEKKNLRHCME